MHICESLFQAEMTGKRIIVIMMPGKHSIQLQTQQSSQRLSSGMKRRINSLLNTLWTSFLMKLSGSYKAYLRCVDESGRFARFIILHRSDHMTLCSELGYSTLSMQELCCLFPNLGNIASTRTSEFAVPWDYNSWRAWAWWMQPLLHVLGTTSIGPG